MILILIVLVTGVPDRLDITMLMLAFLVLKVCVEGREVILVTLAYNLVPVGCTDGLICGVGFYKIFQGHWATFFGSECADL